MSDKRSPSSSVSRRRFVAAVGSTGVSASVAGCFSDDGDDSNGANSDQTVIRWHGGAGDNDPDEVKDNVRQALWDAGLSEDIYVEIGDSPETTDETLDQYRTWLSAGREEPEVLSMDSGWTIPFIARGQLQNLEEIAPESLLNTVKDEYFEASVASASSPDGTLYGVPEFPDFPTMQYRKDLVEEAGYDTTDWQTEPLSWQRFAEITADVKEQSDVKYGFTFQADNYAGLSCCTFNEFMTTWGGAYFGGTDTLFGPVGDRPITVNEEPTVNAVRMVRQFIHGDDPDGMEDYAGGIAPDAVLGWTEETSRSPFTNGNAVMHRNWPYSININGEDPSENEDDIGFGEDLGVMPIPYAVSKDEAEYPGTGGTAAALGGWNSVVNPNLPSEKEDAVVEFLETLTTDAFQLSRLEILGNLPPKVSVLDSDQVRDLPVMGRYIDALRVAGENAMPRPVTVVWPDQSGAIADAVNNTLQKNKPPQKAMDDLAQRLQDIEQST